MKYWSKVVVATALLPLSCSPQSAPRSQDTVVVQHAAYAGTSAPLSTAPAVASQPAAGAAPTGTNQAAPPKRADPGEVRGTMVLHFGDSFAGALGFELKDRLADLGVKSQLRFRKSSYIPDWAWREPLNEYVGRYKPDLVLINVGANELELTDPSIRIKTIHKLVERVGDRPCVWIGVPLWEGARPDLLNVIRENCAPCVYMDTAALVPDMPRARDKIHPSMNARADWAKLVVAWLLEHRKAGAERPWELRPAD